MKVALYRYIKRNKHYNNDSTIRQHSRWGNIWSRFNLFPEEHNDDNTAYLDADIRPYALASNNDDGNRVQYETNAEAKTQISILSEDIIKIVRTKVHPGVTENGVRYIKISHGADRFSSHHDGSDKTVRLTYGIALWKDGRRITEITPFRVCIQYDGGVEKYAAIWL